MADYDPKSVLPAFRKAGLGMPRVTAKKAEPTYSIKPGPATLCFPLMAFVMSAPALPDDFHNVTRSSDGLKSYVRPDGGVFLGLFELPNDPQSTIVVFGDPLMELAEAKRVSIQFRRRLQRILDDAAVAERQAESEAFAGKPSLE